MLVRSLICILAIGTQLLSRTLYAQSYTHHWKPNAGSLWNVASNWDENDVPNGSSTVLISNCSVCPQLTSTNTTVSKLTIEYGGIDLNGKTLEATDELIVNSSVIQAGGGTLNTLLVTTFVNNTINGNLNFNPTEGVLQGGNTFNNDLVLTANPCDGCSPYPRGAMLIARDNADVFKGNTSFINNGHGGFIVAQTGSGTTFQQSFSFTNNSSDYARNTFGSAGTNSTIYFQGSASFTENGTLPQDSYFRFYYCIFQNSASFYSKGGTIDFANAVKFQGNTSLSSDVSNNALFRMGSMGEIFLTNTGNLGIGSSGFTKGQILFERYTHQNSNSFSLQLGNQGTAIQTNPSSNFAGGVTMRADYIELNGGTFSGNSSFERTGGNLSPTATWRGNGSNAGGNQFNAAVSFINQSDTDWYLDESSASQYNATTTLISGQGNSRLYIARSGQTTFQDNVLLESTANASSNGGLWIGNSSNTTTLASGKKITVTSNGYQKGQLNINNFVQDGFDNNAQSLNLGAETNLTLEKVTLKNILNTQSGQLYVNNSLFYRPAFFVKLSIGDNISIGNNQFSQEMKITNQASSGIIKFVTNNSKVK